MLNGVETHDRLDQFLVPRPRNPQRPFLIYPDAGHARIPVSRSLLKTPSNSCTSALNTDAPRARSSARPTSQENTLTQLPLPLTAPLRASRHLRRALARAP